ALSPDHFYSQTMKSLFRLFPIVLLLSSAANLFGRANSGPSSPADADPWTAAQTVAPADLAKELHAERDPAVTVIYVGVHTLYSGAHIPGATFHGPGSTDQGIADLKKFALTLPKIRTSSSTAAAARSTAAPT